MPPDGPESKIDVWMPLFIGDYLADTGRLTTEQHGAYLLLIMDYWRKGAPPDDDAALANIVRLRLSVWKRSRGALQPYFQIHDGRWWHRRVEAELSVARAQKDRRVEKARAAAEARWGKSRPEDDARGNAPSMPGAMPGAMLELCPSPSPSPIGDANASLGDAGAVPVCPHREIIALYAKHLPMGVQVKLDFWRGARAKHLQARWRESKERQSLDWWEKFFAHCARSPFLTGQVCSQGRAPFVVSLDWLLTPEKFSRICEGFYHREAA